MYSFKRVLAGALIATLTLAVPVRGQSDNDLRRENQRLQAENRQLQRELEAAQARIKQLMEENDALRQQLAAARQGRRGPRPDLPPEEVSIDETNPAASPRALFRAMVAGHEETTADLNLKSDEAARRVYLNAVRNWVTRTNREFKAPISWHVRLLEQTGSNSRGLIIKVQAVDPKTGTHLGDPFELLVPRAQARRLEGRDVTTEDYVLRGSLIPEARFNPFRETKEAFDNPPLIGPFAEFAFRVDTRSLVPAKEADEEDDGNKHGGGGGDGG